MTYLSMSNLKDTWNMYAEKVPRRTSLWTVVRTYPVPWALFVAAAVAGLVLALR